jgi:hypothetical protein
MTCRCCGRELSEEYGGCLCAALPKLEMERRDLPVTEGSAMLRRLAAQQLEYAAYYESMGRAEAGMHRRCAEDWIRGAEALEAQAAEDSRCSDEEAL